MTIFSVGAHALIEKDGLFLVTKRLQTDDYMPGKWDLPGGTVEAGEVVEDGLLREVMEETCLQVRIDSPYSVYTTLARLPKRQTVTIIYACQWESGEVVLSEHDEYRWVTKDELQELDRIHFLEALSL